VKVWVSDSESDTVLNVIVSSHELFLLLRSISDQLENTISLSMIHLPGLTFFVELYYIPSMLNHLY
jgi:hypothetical protein